MRIATFLLAASSLAFTAQPATAQRGEARLAPDSAWALDYAEDRCRLARVFGQGSRQLTLALERFRPGEQLRMVLIGNAISPFRGANTMSFRFGPGGEERTNPFFRSQTGDGQNYFDLGMTTVTPAPDMASLPDEERMALMLAPYDPAREVAAGREVREITVSRGVTNPVTLETGELGAPLQAMQACVDELVAYWGLDPTALQAASRPVMPDGPITGWIRGGLVPWQDFGLLAGAENDIRMIVSAEGKAESCSFSEVAPAQRYLTSACEDLMKNAKFQPALDASGEPIKSYWFTNYFFHVPIRVQVR